jgi:hypothetical protein
MGQAAERLRAGTAWEDHDLVFATRHGNSIERTEDLTFITGSRFSRV